MKRRIDEDVIIDIDVDASLTPPPPPQRLPDDCLLSIFLCAPQRAWFLVSKRLRHLLLEATTPPHGTPVDWYELLVAPWIDYSVGAGCCTDEERARLTRHLGPEQERTPLVAQRIGLATQFHYKYVDCVAPLSAVPRAQFRHDFALLFDTVFRCPWSFFGARVALVDWMYHNDNRDVTQPLSLRNHHGRDFRVNAYYNVSTHHDQEHYYTLFVVYGADSTNDHEKKVNGSVQWTHAVKCDVGGSRITTRKTKPTLRTISDLIWLVLDGAPTQCDTRSLKHSQLHARFSKFIVPFCNKHVIMGDDIVRIYNKFSGECLMSRGLQPYRVQWVIYDEVLRLVGVVPLAYEYVADRYNDDVVATAEGDDTKKRLVLVTCPCVSLGQALMERRHALELQLCKTILERCYNVVVEEMLLVVFTDAVSTYQMLELEDDAQLLDYALEVQSKGEMWEQ